MQGFGLQRSRVCLWRTFILTALVVASLGACADGEAPVATAEARLAISVAPLELEQIGFACYDLEVLSVQYTDTNTLTETVWRRGDFNTNRADDAGNFAGDQDTLCSNVFGNGPSGDILYIGTCDATYSQHIVRVVVDGLYKPSGGRLPEGSDWLNPCPPGEPCEFYADCRVNADTPVTINLTVLRSANQGFFDIGVRFDEIFCSAKVDCSYDGGVDAEGTPLRDPIMLVHNADGEPSNTAVIGFACTAGPGQEDLTELYMNAPRVECGQGQAYGEIMSQFFCQPGTAEPELVGFTWFQMGRKSRAGFELLASEFETQQFTQNVNNWNAAGAFPTYDDAFGTTYEAVAPFQSVGPDMMLAYGLEFGQNPISASNGDLAGISVLRIGTLTRTPGNQAWENFHVLAGLEGEALAFDVYRDPISGQLVVHTMSPDGSGYFTQSIYLYAPNGGDPSGFSPLGGRISVPVGVRGRIEHFMDSTLISYVDTDWDAPSPIPVQSGFRAAHTSWPAGDAVEISIDAIAILPTFTDASANEWTLSSVGNNGNPSVLRDGVLLVEAEWYSSTSGTASFPLILRMNDLGGGNYELIPARVPTEPALEELEPGFYGYLDDQSSRAVRWWGHQPAGNQIQYVTSYSALQAPYDAGWHSDWNTWEVPTWNGNNVDLRSVIEGRPGQVALAIGQVGYSQSIQTNQPCDPLSLDPYQFCNNPPANNGWSPWCIATTPPLGECVYDVWSNDTIFGFLGAGASDSTITWVGEVPAPAGTSQTSLQGVRETEDGRELLFEHYGSNWSASATAQAVVESAAPTLGRVYRLDPGLFQEAYVRDNQNGENSRFRFDVRTRSGPDSCSRVYVGLARPAPEPGWENVDLVYSAAWNLDSAAATDNNPLGALPVAPSRLEPSAAYMSAVEAAIAGLNSGQGYYVLPLDISEGYAWDIANNPADPGVVFQYGVYYGEEELMCGDEPCNKKYFNVAIGIDPAYTNCVLAFEATAAKPGVITPENGWQTPPGAVYPVIVSRVNLTPEIAFGPGESAGVCGQNPLNGRRSGVQTMYTHGTDEQGFPFCYHLDLDGRTVKSHCEPDYDYSSIDSNPIFGSSRGIDLGGPTRRDTQVPVQDAPLSFGSDGIGMGQFETAAPDCLEGMHFQPELFACLGQCGDGVQTDDEACDDGALAEGDGCDSTCQVEVFCADGVTRIPSGALCDGRSDCPGPAPSWDERPSFCAPCKAPSLGDSPVVYCDGHADCPDRRDEDVCAPAGD